MRMCSTVDNSERVGLLIWCCSVFPCFRQNINEMSGYTMSLILFFIAISIVKGKIFMYTFIENKNAHVFHLVYGRHN